MKVVILAGGLGTRLSEETSIKPKPMVEIGGKPILWHIMKIYSHFGFNEFIVCLGYKGYIVKEYFANYYLHQSDITFDLSTNSMEIHKNNSEPWKITLVDTGDNSMTGGRLKRIKEYVNNETFMLTYGDGVSDVNINELIEHHQSTKQIATVTAAQPTGRFGALKINDDDFVKSFQEKPAGDGTWVNAGFFVLEPEIFNYLENDATVFEKEPLQNLAHDKQLKAFYHNGFWMPMDKLPEFCEKRNANFHELNRIFSKYEDYFILPEATSNSDPAWFSYIVTIKDTSPFKRDELTKYLNENLIETRNLFAGNLVRQPALKDRNYRIAEHLNNSDYIMNNTFFLGTYPGNTEEKLDYIANVLSSFINKV